MFNEIQWNTKLQFRAYASAGNMLSQWLTTRCAVGRAVIPIVMLFTVNVVYESDHYSVATAQRHHLSEDQKHGITGRIEKRQMQMKVAQDLNNP
ncbi:hypothetical protein TNCT_475591 [Trichonephila clavata]|uniref:Uncharacterized protein n=1 Tax=Trichonephila clavata TaxID=2740835 RepID=A0A8X6I664_TRICU|nr:hypothetical protein TNCT_475591 [Trichonephila clavata]